MSLNNKYIVKSIDNFETKDWLLKKHYARTMPNIMYAFGLFTNDLTLKGVCCYGTPANNHNNQLDKFKQIELVRLVNNDNMEKNILSWFVSKTFKMLPRPISLVSYADEGKIIMDIFIKLLIGYIQD